MHSNGTLSIVRNIVWNGLLLILAMYTAATATAQEADTAPEPGPAEIVQRTADKIINAIEQQQAGYEQDPGKLRQRVTELLRERVDYGRIARGVVGRYRSALSEQELKRFTEVFRRSMVQLYTDALVSFGVGDIEVTGADVEGQRASVHMSVVTEAGESFDLIYRMADSGQGWMVLNILIDGLNLGMTYRNQFASLMERHDGNVDRVIDNWMQAAREASADTAEPSP